MALQDVIKAFEDAMIQRLIDTAILGINGIVYNKELRDGNIQPPYIHIFPDPSPVNGSVALAITEEWFFRFTIMVIAASYKSLDADQARDLALQASRALLWNPITSLPDRLLNGTVNDIVRAVWHAEFTKELPTEQLFGAAMEMEARTLIREV